MEALVTNLVLFLLILTIIILGIVVYIYLRQEQKKFVAPKDKYDEAWDKFYNKTPSRSYSTWVSSTPLLNRVLIFLFTYGLAPTFILLLITDYFASADASFLSIIGVSIVLLVFSPFFLPIFPMGLIEFVSANFDRENSFIMNFSLFIGWFPYITIFLLGIFAKNRRAFNIIYLVFVMLLIMNIIGCASIIKDIDLSAIN